MPARKKVDRTELVRLHEEGLTQKEMAEHFGVQRTTIWRTCKELGLDSKYKPITPERRKHIQLMLDDGWSWKEIERTEGANYDTMRRHFPGTAWTHSHNSRLNATTRDIRPRMTGRSSSRRKAA